MRWKTPRASSSAAISSMAFASPDSVTPLGPLMAAMDTSASRPRMAARAPSSESPTAAIFPRPAAFAWMRLRS